MLLRFGWGSIVAKLVLQTIDHRFPQPLLMTSAETYLIALPRRPPPATTSASPCAGLQHFCAPSSSPSSKALCSLTPSDNLSGQILYGRLSRPLIARRGRTRRSDSVRPRGLKPRPPKSFRPPECGSGGDPRVPA